MKKAKLITIIATIALILVVVITLISGTFARYATTEKDTATIATATWNFAAGLGNTTTKTINLYDTIANASTTYPNLAANKIAPGTSGTFNVEINGAGSEVGIDYTITFAKANEADVLPTGLSFKVNGNDYSIGGTPYTGTVAKANVGTTVTVPVTWEWTYGNTEGQDNYDQGEETGDNNTDAAKTLTININIRGEQHIGAI